MAILKQLEDEYEILHKLQESAVGTIHKVRHRRSEELRMVLARPQPRSDAGQGPRFLPEAHAASRLGHPNVARVFDAAIDDGGVALVVVELIHGMPLAELLALAETSRLPRPRLALTLEIARQGLHGIGHLHDHRVIHGDVSPDNLMLTRDAHGQPLVKLIDLGVARDPRDDGGSTGAEVAPEARKRQHRAPEARKRQHRAPEARKRQHRAPEARGGYIAIGRLRYAAPETFDDQGTEDPRSDLYAFGLVLYELLTGRFPISGESASSLIAGHLFRPPLDFAESDPRGRIPDQVRDAVLKALAKSPGERFADAASFAEALATDVGQDLSTPDVLRILELAGAEGRRPDRIATAPNLEDAPTRILRPPALEEPPQNPQKEATRILRPPALEEPPETSEDAPRIFQQSPVEEPPQVPEEAPTRILRPPPAAEPTQASDREAPTRISRPPPAPASAETRRLSPDEMRAIRVDAPGSDSPAPATAGEPPAAGEQPTERLDDDGVLRALRTEAALAQGKAASEESTTVIRDPTAPVNGQEPPAPAVTERPAAEAAPGLDETLHAIRSLRDDGRAGEALEQLNRAVREFGPQPTLRILRDELGEALLERDAEEEESASQMFEIEPSVDAGPGPPSGGRGATPNLAEAPVRNLSDATIRSFETPVQRVRDRPDPPTAHPTRNMVAAGLVLVVVFAAMVYFITRGGPASERPSPEVEDVTAAELSPGSLVLDAVPWAEIVALENPALEDPPPITPSRFTPVILNLPPGEYRISLRFPPTDQAQELVVQVDSDARIEERVVFESLDAEAYFERIGW